MKLFVGIDPGMTATSVVVLGEGERYLQKLVVKPDKDSPTRTWELCYRVWGWLVSTGVAYTEPGNCMRIAVEMPFRKTLPRAAQGRRSAMTLPAYGMAVGGCVIAAEKTRVASHCKVQLLYPHAGEWARGVPGFPAAGDDDKAARVEWVRARCPAFPRDVSKADAAGLADAYGLALWAMYQEGTNA